MALQHVSQINARLAQLATSSLLVIQATIAATAISAFSTQSVSAQEVKANDQSPTQLLEPDQLPTLDPSLVQVELAICWTNAANCSYKIIATPEARINPYAAEQLNALPSLNALTDPVTVVRVRIQF